jgi:RecA/RadA recombinase
MAAQSSLAAIQFLKEVDLQQRLTREYLNTNIQEVDGLLEGFPRGAITEIYGASSSGRTTLVQSFLASASSQGEYCVWWTAAAVSIRIPLRGRGRFTAPALDTVRGQRGACDSVRRPVDPFRRLGSGDSRPCRCAAADRQPDPDFLLVPIPAGGREYADGATGNGARALREIVRRDVCRDAAVERDLVRDASGFPAPAGNHNRDDAA